MYGRVTQTNVDELATLEYNYDKGNLKRIIRTANGESQNYTLEYDAFGNSKSIKVGNRTLATYEYLAGNGPLTSQTYGNGLSATYGYDILGRTKTVTYSDGLTLTYTYTGDGQLYSITAVEDGEETKYLYNYDSLGRLIYSERKDDGATVLRARQGYDDVGRLVTQTWQVGSETYTEGFTYNSTQDGSLNTHTIATGDTLTYGYDELRRLSTVSGSVYDKSCTYRDITTTETTNQVAGLVYDLPTDQSFSYTYDSMGNIHTYADANGEVEYTYDALGQLTKAEGSTTYEYSYDNAGNILSANGHTYTYGDSTWADLLTAVDGHAITYDAAGNPTSYYNGTNWTFTWEHGRNLGAATNGTTSLEFTYDVDGLRTTKKVNDVLHTYYYAGGTLLRETYGNTVLDFFYAGGTPYALKHNGTLYYYITNLQGDVMSIVDEQGNVVASYEYDPYGNVISATGDLAETNPLRYRGYYYDAETGLYYVSSRYYDPEIGRFINADAVDLLGANGDFASYNLFAYCGNNPIIRKDADGYAWETIWDAISLATSVAEVVANPYDPWAWIGLAGDAADVLIPFVGGIGETTRALKAASQAAEMIDTASDAKKGWKIGEDITSLTKAGNVPSWSTLRSRYWKNKAYYFASEYSEENVSRMMRGLAPQFDDGAGLYSMELHHMLGREGNNYYLFFEISPEGHAIVDPFRFLK